MKRQILVATGLFVLFLLFCFNTGAYAGQYKVKKGENLSTISKHLGVSVTEIKKANHLKGNNLKPGQILYVKQKRSASPVFVKSKSQPTSSYTGKKRRHPHHYFKKNRHSLKTNCRIEQC